MSSNRYTKKSFIVVGHIRGVFGVDGCLRVESFTDPAENIQNFDCWLIGHGRSSYRLLETKPSARGIIARLEGIQDRDAAMQLMDQKIRVKREWLAPLPKGSYYWFDLIGLRVFNLEGEEIGKIEKLHETGSNDVLVVVGSRLYSLIPYIEDSVVKNVDLDAGKVIVDWNTEWCDARHED